MNKQTFEMINRLTSLGISTDDAWALRKIAMTLHRWHELECGTENGCISRVDETGKPYWQYSHGRVGYWIPDRETGARKRLAKIMARYPALESYVQGDPRGAALFVLRESDIPENTPLDSCYSRGIAVYQ